MGKNILQSKTFYFNSGVPAAWPLLTWAAESFFGVIIPNELAGAVLAIGNVLLRIITDEPISGIGPIKIGD